jgi:SAM-dependent methyltransferase
LWALARYFPSASTLLEVGCGTGYVLSAIERARPHMKLAGGEFFLEGAAFASRRVQRAHIMRMDARDIPYENEFDVVGAFDVFEHVEEDERVFREIHRSLRPGGGLLATVPQHPWLWSTADEVAHHKRRYNRRELLSKVRDAGFTLQRCTSFVTVLMPLMMMSRLVRRPGRELDPLKELSLPGPLNRLLEQMMSLERWLIRGGIPMPFGGSLLLVATKA